MPETELPATFCHILHASIQSREAAIPVGLVAAEGAFVLKVHMRVSVLGDTKDRSAIFLGEETLKVIYSPRGVNR